MTGRRRALEAAEELRNSLRGKVQAQADVAKLTTFRLGGPAALFIEPVVEEDLFEIARVVAEYDLETLVLGRGSNLLLSDRGFDGVVVRIGKAFDWIKPVKDLVEAGGGTALPQLANWAARRGLTGFEFAVAIPASVGGAVKMNAGAHDGSMSDVLRVARIFQLDSGNFIEVGPDKLGMQYRRTRVRQTEIVCSAKFALAEADQEQIAEKMQRYRTHRAQTQPTEAFNAGSMFKNPDAGSAGQLIESAGMKGSGVGGAEVSDKHANFFIAGTGASAQDVYDLMAKVQATVMDKFGVLLVPEVRIVGKFDETNQLRTA